jgi:predicted transcriptional regulator
MNLKSTTNEIGRYVTQIIHFKGQKLTFSGIDTESIKQGQFTKMKLKDGRMLMINDSNVLAIEVFKEND